VSVPSGSPHGLQRDKSATELVRALLIVNGGGAAALLVFLQAIWKSDPLPAKSTAWAIVILGLGAFLAAAFHLLRYEASWYHGNGQMTLWWIFRKLYLSAAIASLVAFVSATVIFAIGALWTISPQRSPIGEGSVGAAFWIQLAGTIAGFVGTAVLAYGYHAPSPGIHEAAGQPIATRAISLRAWYSGLVLVAVGFGLQAAGMLCGAFR
jgi:hypothetical protein